MSTNQALLQLNNIHLSVENFALEDLSIHIQTNEIHAIMGENGSGKSLLMEVICGGISASSGTIYYDGQLYTPSSYKQAAINDCIYIRQHTELLQNLSIAENLFFHQLPYRSKFLKMIDYDLLDFKFMDLVTTLGLPFNNHDTVASLGSAQRQILEFCKAYISDAKIVILDEPASSLTISEKSMLYNIVRHIRDKGAAVFYITHCIDDVLELADRVTVMRKGRIVGSSKIDEGSEQEIIDLLSFDHLNKRYPKIHTTIGKALLSVKHLNCEDKLKDINFDLHEGEILGITGLAGSGRTLLANCLFGAAKVTGHIMISGEEVYLSSPKQAIDRGIALMPEDRITDSIIKYLDTDENVALPSLTRFSNSQIINGHHLRQTTTAYMDKINLPHNLRNNIMNYNNNHLQKAIFAKWIMSRAKIFILDEPNKGVDIPSKIDTYNFINDLIRKKAGVILISSDIEEIFGVCDRVAVLSNNTLSYIETVKNSSVEAIVKHATIESQIS